MIKYILLLTISLAYSKAYSGWSEQVDCLLKKTSIDYQTTETHLYSFQLLMEGPHNGESGQHNFSVPSVPAYNFTLEKTSGGRNDEITLTSQIGKNVVAKSSIDPHTNSSDVSNIFITNDLDYQIVLTCKSN